jgi:hypothetical protein
MSDAMTQPLKFLLAALLLTFLGATLPARAQGNGAPVPATPPAEQVAPAKPGWGLSISNFLSDDEMDMLFDYLRDSFIATMRNDPEGATMAPELAFKLAILRQRLIKEGDAAVQQLMQALQKEMDRAQREYNQRQAPPQAPPQPAPGVPGRT